MNLLFLADPNSIHDIKWVSFFSEKFNCFLVARKTHISWWTEQNINDFQKTYRVAIIGCIEDFSVRRFWKTTKEAKKLNAWFKEYHIDIFHILYAEPNALWSNFRQASNVDVKWILTTRGTDILKTIPAHLKKRDLLNRVVSLLYKRSLRHFDCITCTSTGQIASIQKIAPKLSPTIIRTGIDIGSIQQDTSTFLPAFLNGKKFVLFPRNMRPLYDHEFSLEAIALLPPELKSHYVFVFVDKNSGEKDYVDRIRDLMQLDPTSSFVFLDRQEQTAMFELYKRAALVVMTPLSDGSPVSAMEALMCKTPVILPPLDYDKDLFSKGVYILSSREPKELSTVISKALSGEINFDVEGAKAIMKQNADRKKEMNRLNRIIEELTTLPKTEQVYSNLFLNILDFFK